MKTYKGGLAEIAKYGGRREALKMRCFSVGTFVYHYFNFFCRAAHYKAQSKQIVDELRKP